MGSSRWPDARHQGGPQPPARPALCRGNSRFFYSPGCDRARCRHRARAARPPRRLPRRCSAPATWHDAGPRRRSRRRAARPACGRISVMRSSASLRGGAGAAQGRRPPHSGQGRGADNRYAARRVLQGRAGIVWVAVRPGGKPVGDTVPAAAGADGGVFPKACWPGTTRQPSHRREPISREIAVLKEIGQIRLPVRRGYGWSPSR